MGKDEDLVLSLIQNLTVQVHVLKAENKALLRTLAATLQKLHSKSEADEFVAQLQKSKMEEAESMILQLGERNPAEAEILRQKFADYGIHL